MRSIALGEAALDWNRVLSRAWRYQRALPGPRRGCANMPGTMTGSSSTGCGTRRRGSRARRCRAADALCGVPARHARSVVRAALSGQAARQATRLEAGMKASCCKVPPRSCSPANRNAGWRAQDFRPWAMREAVVSYGTAQPPPFGPAMAEAFRAAVPGLGARRYLLFISRIHEKKGIDVLLGAFVGGCRRPSRHRPGHRRAAASRAIAPGCEALAARPRRRVAARTGPGWSPGTPSGAPIMAARR